MNNKLKIIISAAVLASVPFMAKADEVKEGFSNNVYMSIGGGMNFPLNSNIDSVTSNETADWDTSWVGHGAIGYEFDGDWEDWRAEIEGAYRTNDNGKDKTGDVSVWSLMGNVIHDFELNEKWTPYLGAGIGMTWLDPQNVYPAGSGASWSDNSTSWAYQAMAGVGYELADDVELTLNYRFFGTPDHSGNRSDNTSVDSEYHSHDVTVGLRWSFGAIRRSMKKAEEARLAEGVPASSPVTPVYPESYLVFFNFNSATLTPEAVKILEAAAKSYKETGKARIELTGHADRSGPKDYNMGLSKRRADAVRKQMEKLGIAGKELKVYAKGENKPLVPTPDGVREPQNRRVEIVPVQ